MSETTENVFDPAAHNVDDVKTYLDAADADERTRVLEAEQTGKARAGVLEYEPKTDPAEQPAENPPAEPKKKEKVQPQRYDSPKVGSEAEHTVYGNLLDDGTVQLTGDQGRKPVKPGVRGVIVVQKGDVITRAIAATLAGK